MPQEFKRFKEIEVIGTGGFGTTLLVEDQTESGRRVVIKIPLDEETEGALINDMINNAVVGTSLKEMEHPNIVRYLGFAKHEGRFVMMLEHVKGKNLRKFVGPLRSQRRPPMDLDVALRIAVDACSGLAAVHTARVFHSDIKPENILIRDEDGSALLCDFGISHILRTTSATRAGGTTPYMAPEALGGTASFQADIWSLSVTLYEMVTGALPFAWTGDEAAFIAKIKEGPPPPKELNPKIDDQLNDLILRGLERDLQKRFQNAKDMLTALEACLRSDPNKLETPVPAQSAGELAEPKVSVVAATASVGTSRKKIPKWLMPALGYTLSALSLIWVFHDFNFQQTFSDLKTLDWRYVTLAVIFDLAVYVSHGWRWNILLRPVACPSLWRTVQAIYIGLYANEILPLRTGEVIRCYLLAHWNNIPIALAVASAAIERILDGIWLVIAMLITTRLVPLPQYLVDGTEILGIGLSFLLALLIFVAVHKQKAHAVVSESKWASGLRHVVEGIHAMGNWRTMLATAGASLVYLALQIAPWWLLMEGYGLDLTVWAAAVVYIVVRLGTVIPNAPGNAGVTQLFCVLGLQLFHVPQSTAKEFSLIVFGVLTLPLLIGGFVAVALTGLTLKDIRSKAHCSVQATVEVVPD
jgi:uncharacterized protein (TIRG00374 family)